MSETKKSMGPVLRELGGGEVQILTTRSDWETRRVGEGAQSGYAFGQSLVAFSATSYREFVPNSDLWEFRVEEGKTNMRVFLHGEDIFLVRVESALG